MYCPKPDQIFIAETKVFTPFTTTIVDLLLSANCDGKQLNLFCVLEMNVQNDK
jgi:hypothetical protein